MFLKKISILQFFGYCNCDLICDIVGNDYYYIIILIFIEKYNKMIMV